MKVNQNTMTGSFLCNKGIRQGTAILSPVLLIFSSFMNDLPEYFRAHNCPGVMLGNQSLNCLMLLARATSALVSLAVKHWIQQL